MSRHHRRGLTFVEVLVVVVIVIVAIGMLIPATRNVREASERIRCQNHLKQLMTGLHSYHDAGKSAETTESHPPLSMKFPTGCIGPGDKPEQRLSWIVPILPHIEEGALFSQFNTELGYEGNRVLAKTIVKTLKCPTDKKNSDYPFSNYIAMAGIGAESPVYPAGHAMNGFMGYDRITGFKSITDGTSNTVALNETRSDPGFWARGGTSNVRGFVLGQSLEGENRPFGIHPGGMIVAMADGSARVVAYNISPATFAAVMTIAGDDHIGGDW